MSTYGSARGGACHGSHRDRAWPCCGALVVAVLLVANRHLMIRALVVLEPSDFSMAASLAVRLDMVAVVGAVMQAMEG